LAAQHNLVLDDLEPWVDGLVPEAMKRSQIAGVVVVVVKDGKVLLEKGYGYADVAGHVPVDPRRTLFRPGSISKLFTWTAVMQLVQAGKIDLDADVNTYLDFKIPPRDGKPITMRNIMTHTTGFEEAGKTLIVSKSDAINLGRNLKKWIPARVFAPGVTPAYSNYGAALAGYVVERVSGEPFERYIKAHIFDPLGMTHSSFEQPLPPALLSDMSKSYRNVALPPSPFELVTLPPAGSLSATGDDMSKFMIAHLQNGRLGSAEILKPATAIAMHTTSLALMAPLQGMELGFTDNNINGRRVISHGGDTAYFHSKLALFLNEGVGLFVSQNSLGVRSGSLRDDLFQGFADRYFPDAAKDGVVDLATQRAHAQIAAGRYIGSRSSFSSFAGLSRLLGEPAIIANSDGTISVSILTLPGGALRKFREISPFVWRDIAGGDRIAVKVENGRAVRFSGDFASAIMVWDRAPASQSGWLLPALQAALLVLLASALGWPIIALVRRHYKARFAYTGRRAAAYRAVRAASAFALLIVYGWFYILSLSGSDNGLEKLGRLDAAILLLEGLTIVSVLAGCLSAVFNAYVVFANPAGWASKLWAALLVAAFAVLTWVAILAHLMRFTTNY
jgi:CubicO group peptidase (beta-lactamase class C family)